MNTKTKKVLLLLALLTLFVLLITTIIPGLQPTPEVVSSIPVQNSTSIEINTPITINLSGKIRQKDITLQSNYLESFIITANDTIITAAHEKSFYVNTRYSVIVFYKNKPIHTLNFTTQKQQSNPRALQELQDEVKRDYPLASLTPFKTDNFQAVYIAPLSLEIELYSPDFDKNSALKEVKAWVQSNNIDPDSHQYSFKPEAPLGPATTKVTN